MPAVAATNPPVLIGLVASATSRIRVGSGGVMLPNHAPLVVAEQFALLEAAYPGRIDLGIGRAPGTDPVTSFALRHGAGGVTDEAVSPVPGVRRQRAGDDGAVRRRARAWPAAPTRCGRRRSPGPSRRSGCSAPPTTRPGWPPRRGCPTSSPTTSPAPAPPRRSSSTAPRSGPSPELAEPRTFLTVNAVVAESAEEAERRALPNLLMMVALRTGAPLGPQLLVEEAEKVDAARRAPPAGGRDALPLGRRRPRLGPRPAAESLAATYGVDEVMVHPVAAAHVGTDPAPQPGPRGDAAAAGPGNLGIRPPTALDWHVGPTWVCLVAPRRLPGTPGLDLAQAGLDVCRGNEESRTAA